MAVPFTASRSVVRGASRSVPARLFDGGSLASALLGAETNGLALSFIDGSAVIRDTVTPGNNYTGSVNGKLTYSSPTTKWIRSSSGGYESGATLRTEYGDSNAALGLRVEGESRINVVLRNRDLSDAAWTKTNITAVKDQAGIDGVTNSASSITATAGNGACLQAITLASSARAQSAFIKRLAGSGAIEMTTDNGTTWTAVTVTASWTRATIPVQTLANPTVGFRIATSGDAVAIDFVQNETSSVTSPIETEDLAVTRAADVITLATSLFNYSAAAGILAVAFRRSDTTQTSIGIVAGLDDGTSDNGHRATYSGGYVVATVVGGVNQTVFAALGADSTLDRQRVALSWATNDFAACRNGGTVSTDVSGTLPTVTRLGIGLNMFSQGGGEYHIESLLYLPRNRASNAELQGFLA